MPYWWRVQWLYPIYRCTLSFYFLVWLIYIASNSHIYGTTEQYLSLLTNWSFILWNIYLMVSAINVTINQLCQQLHCCQRRCCSEGSRPKRWSCTYGQDKTTICDKISWLLFTVSTELAVAVCLLYWSILNRNNEEYPIESGANLHIHLLNGIVALLDVWVTGFPVHLFHFFYTFVCISTYAVFTGIHYATNSTSRDGERYIYPILDYGSRPGLAVGVVFGVLLVLFPLLHLFIISQYLLRHWITSRFLQNKLRIYRKYIMSRDNMAVDGSDIFNDDGEMSEAGTSRITCSTAAVDDCDV